MDFLDQLPFDQTALTIGMVAVVVLFMVISIIKGILRTLFSLLGLAVAVVAFFFGYQQSPPHIEKLVPEAVGWMPLVAGGVCAVLAMMVFQFVLGIFSGKGGDGEERKSGGLLSALFGLVIGALALYGGLSALRYYGGEAELQHLQTYVSKGAEKAENLPFVIKLKQWVDDSPIASWQERFDFFNTAEQRARSNLAKLFMVSGDRQDLAKTLREEDNRDILEIPEVTALTVAADDLRRLCEEGDFQKFFADERVQNLLDRPDLREKLLKLDLEEFFARESEKAK
ncbi:CvpA family protein [Roseibacillus ishigakijimensis]|uniref:CvpA family protein n=1 Tax=Roseibacillus ishigakijimensis TaxID=454146 RepID=A0A934RJR9_9BACT|nr:CvpA family protein [Roseibacillus ishigakijimensis]MBK1832709.1 CvpA family protein [Roseibacillus ishigakijimensis]